jgi:hypothetical protein
MRQASVYTSLGGTYLHRLSHVFIVLIHPCPCRDLGQTEFSENTVMHVLADPKQQFTIIAGDLSYADGDQPRWDRWGNLFEPLISTRVFQPAVMMPSTLPGSSPQPCLLFPHLELSGRWQMSRDECENEGEAHSSMMGTCTFIMSRHGQPGLPCHLTHPFPLKAVSPPAMSIHTSHLDLCHLVLCRGISRFACFFGCRLEIMRLRSRIRTAVFLRMLSTHQARMARQHLFPSSRTRLASSMPAQSPKTSSMVSPPLSGTATRQVLRTLFISAPTPLLETTRPKSCGLPRN